MGNGVLALEYQVNLGPALGSHAAPNGTVIFDLTGPELAATAAELQDGDPTDFLALREFFGPGSPIDTTVFYGESGFTVPDLTGSSIAAIRFIIEGFCSEGSLRLDPCGFGDPGLQGWHYDAITILISDSPFQVPEPPVAALIATAGAAGLFARRKRGRG